MCVCTTASLSIHLSMDTEIYMGLPGGTSGKESACQCRRHTRHGFGLVHESGRSPEVENGDTLQYSCLENTMDKEAWQLHPMGVTKSQTQLSEHTHIVYQTKFIYIVLIGITYIAMDRKHLHVTC